MTKNEFKIGDKVRIKNHPLVNPDYVGRICEVASVSEGACVTFKNCDSYWHTEVLELVEPLDPKTAFLTELQELLRRYDARIYDGELYSIHIEVGYHSTKSEQADYLFYESDNDEINADNIMEFDKE